jgi:uncharacterized protein
MSWRDELSALLAREARPEHKIGHQPRLYALTQQIGAAAKRPYDDDVVFAAAYLHDLGVFIGHRPEEPALLARWNHVTYTCERTPEILTAIGFPAGKIPHVLACIREHQPQDTPASFEATLLRDADILEQLGAIGILRTVSKVSNDTRFTYFSQARAALQRSLYELPGKIQLEGTQKLAAPRIAALRSFLEAIDAEASEHLD